MTLSSAGPDAEQLEAIGITNQCKTTLVRDRETGQPTHNTIVWQDRRTTDHIKTLETEDKTGDVRAGTGFEPDAYFSATEAEWLLDNFDPIKSRRSRPEDIRDHIADSELALGTIDTWLVYNLTGNHIMDMTSMSRTILLNIRDIGWDDELFDEFSVPRELPPEVRPSSDDDYYDTTDADGSLNAEVLVADALGDQQATLLGQIHFDAGDARNTYDTGLPMLTNTGDEVVMPGHGLLATVGFQRFGEPIQYALEGSILITGAAVEWFEGMTLIGNAAESERLTRSVESTGGTYFVPAFMGLGTPHQNQRARGTIVGMTRGTRREHIVCTTFESITFQTYDMAETMGFGSEIGLSSPHIDGGAVKNNFLCQLQLNILDMEIVRPQVDETTTLGAAYVASLAVGYQETLDELRENWQVDREFAPKDPQDVEHRYDRWKEAVDRSLDWAREE